MERHDNTETDVVNEPQHNMEKYMMELVIDSGKLEGSATINPVWVAWEVLYAAVMGGVTRPVMLAYQSKLTDDPR